ncbi:MAG TPA: hypothetical protein VGI45_29460 [Terracidiphilus sp.]|jgi:hypothetical protein
MHLKSATLVLAISATALALSAQTLAPLHAKCSIRRSKDVNKFSLHVTDDSNCPTDSHCGSNFDTESMSRFTGITADDLDRDGTHLVASLTDEAGTFTCTGIVHDSELYGDGLFTPDSTFVDRMAKLGFTGYDSQKLQAYTFLNVTSEYAQSLQQANIKGLTTDNLIALRIFKVDPAYAQSFVTMGYEQPDADKLIGLKVQGVNADEVRQIRALGYQPTLDELIQIRIFHVTPDFIHRMQDRGFKNLTIAKLVQIRIFNLAE